jgi:hypothetical protein
VRKIEEQWESGDRYLKVGGGVSKETPQTRPEGERKTVRKL